MAIERRTASSRAFTAAKLRGTVENRDADTNLIPFPTPRLCTVSAGAKFHVYRAERGVVLSYDRPRPAGEQLLATAIHVVRLLANLAATSRSARRVRGAAAGIARMETALGHLKQLRLEVTGTDGEIGFVRKYASKLDNEFRRAVIDLAAMLTTA